MSIQLHAITNEDNSLPFVAQNKDFQAELIKPSFLWYMQVFC